MLGDLLMDVLTFILYSNRMNFGMIISQNYLFFLYMYYLAMFDTYRSEEILDCTISEPV